MASDHKLANIFSAQLKPYYLLAMLFLSNNPFICKSRVLGQWSKRLNGVKTKRLKTKNCFVRYNGFYCNMGGGGFDLSTQPRKETKNISVTSALIVLSHNDRGVLALMVKKK